MSFPLVHSLSPPCRNNRQTSRPRSRGVSYARKDSAQGLAPELRGAASPGSLAKVEEDASGASVSASPFTFDEGWGAEILDDKAEKDFLEDDDSDENLKNAMGDPRYDLLPRHVVKRLQAQQVEATAVNGETTREKVRELKSQRRTHKRLRIISGMFAGRRLASPRSRNVRPMMERVRAAVFDMLLSQSGGMGGFPSGTRWLDLFAGTGSVGLEALSRGCADCHFIELDPWVASSILEPNIVACGCEMKATVHTMRAEDYLKRAAEQTGFSRGEFHFISVCPPYLQVSYPEIQDLLEQSGLINERTVIFVEYPKQLKDQMRPKIGPLSMVKDRRYGRTFLAVYAAA